MFTVYIDDSGTDPRHHVAIASGLIIPAKRIAHMEREWNTFLAKEKFDCFHTSECVARNHHSQFADWDDQRVSRVLTRIRQIIKKYSPQAYSVAINKAVYESVIPEEMRHYTGRDHYTWAVDAVGGFIYNWAHTHNVPMEYVFDTVGPAQKKEIEKAMEHGELIRPGSFVGHFSFRKRCDVPALQCADLFAWTCYQVALNAIRQKPIPPLANECWQDFIGWNNTEWCGAVMAKKDALEDWVRRVYANPEELKMMRASL